MWVSQASVLSVSGSKVPLIPALFTRTSSLPKLATVVATVSRQSASRVTSSLTKRACPPAAAILSTTWRPSTSRTSPTTTLAPSRQKIVASLWPIPLAPPVMSATFPVSLIPSPSRRLGRRIHIACSGGARPVLGGDLASGIQVGATHGFHVRAEDGLAVGARPLVRRP